MEKASFLVTDGIPGFAAKGEIIKVSDDGIHIGRWLPISKYRELMESRDSLGPLRKLKIFYRLVAHGDRGGGDEPT